MDKGYILVEGHGEVEAAGNLITRLAHDLGYYFPWAAPIRWKNLHKQYGLTKGAEYIRSMSDAAVLLVLKDEDDDCPRETGPVMAGWLRSLGLPFASSLVLFKPEYEVLFLPCLSLMAGKQIGEGPKARTGLEEGATWIGDWERKRDVKGFLSSKFPPGRSYKPTIDQLPLTRMIDLATLREAEVPCFGTLERAIHFLGQHQGQSVVYPPPVD